MKVILNIVLLMAALVHGALLFLGGLYVIEHFELTLMPRPHAFAILTVLAVGGLTYFPLVVRALFLRLPTDDVAERKARRGRNR